MVTPCFPVARGIRVIACASPSRTLLQQYSPSWKHVARSDLASAFRPANGGIALDEGADGRRRQEELPDARGRGPGNMIEPVPDDRPTEGIDDTGGAVGGV